jgi:UDP-N-acetylglucosamine 2-epimerase (non-hydrolysing)
MREQISVATERPETLAVGSNILAGTDPEKIVECTSLMVERANKWQNPFGDGTTGERIVAILSDKIRC